MKYLTSLLLLILVTSGCAVKLETEPVEVNGQIEHVISLDVESLISFFTTYCEGQHEEKEDVDKCVSDGLGLFWNALSAAVPQSEG